ARRGGLGPVDRGQHRVGGGREGEVRAWKGSATRRARSGAWFRLRHSAGDAVVAGGIAEGHGALAWGDGRAKDRGVIVMVEAESRSSIFLFLLINACSLISGADLPEAGTTLGTRIW